MNISIGTYKSGISAIILDMDGVLVDTEPLHVESFRRYLSKLQINYPDGFIESFIGYSIEDNIKKINAAYLKGREMPVDEGVRLRDTYFVELIRNTPLIPAHGFTNLLHKIKKYQLRLALASSSINEHIDIILENLSSRADSNGSLKESFHVITGGNEVGQKKPAPDIYLRTLQKLNFHADTCIAVEDSYAGIRSAQAAGIMAVGLRNRYIDEKKLATADLIIDSIQELADQIIPEDER